MGICIDLEERVLVTGRTTSPDFPTTPNAFAQRKAGGMDAFLLELARDGGSLLFSTYLGGDAEDEAVAVAADAQGRPCVVGSTRSSDFPVNVSTFQETRGGERDAFVTKMSADGSGVLFSTFLGGKRGDQAQAVAFDESGAVYVGGSTSSTDFPVTPSAFSITRRDTDGFAAKLSPDGRRLEFCTFLGGRADDRVNGIAIDADRDLYLVGATRSADFPTTAQAMTPSSPGGWSGFFTKLNSAGSGLVTSTYLGGSGVDECFDIALDQTDRIWIVGRTGSRDFPPNPEPPQTENGGAEDAFVLELEADGSLRSASLFGGGADDRALAVAVEPYLRVTVVTGFAGRGLPTTPGAFEPHNAGRRDAFVTRLDHGYCGSPARVHLMARGCGATMTATPPRLGQVSTIHISGAPPLSLGIVLCGPPGMDLVSYGPGCDGYLSGQLHGILEMFTTDTNGEHTIGVPVQDVPAQCGLTLLVQGAVFSNSHGPLPFGSITDALLVVLGD
jgi:hypothetical protein